MAEIGQTSTRKERAPLLQPGEQLGGYLVQELVGRGGMGEVYRARQVSMDRTVALKVLAPHLAKRDPTFAERFVAEARAAGRFSNPNIVLVHDVGKAPGPKDEELHFFSMEFIEGESVKEVLVREGRLKPELLSRIMLGMAAALRYAEAEGIVHRDIKPDNIMLTKDGGVKLADLGLAQPAQDATAVGGDGRDEQGRLRVMGTPMYMSPEQARGLPVDHRSDQYSLGATLFHLLTGEPPFPGDDPRAMMLAHVRDPVPDPAEVVDGVPEGWRQLCMRLLAKEPEGRFATASLLRQAVEAACAGLTLEEWQARNGPWRPPPWMVVGAVTALLALALGWALFGSGGRQADPPRSPPQTPRHASPATASETVARPPTPKPRDPVAENLAAAERALAEDRLADAAAALAALEPSQGAELRLRLERQAAAAARELGDLIAKAKGEDLDGLADRIRLLPLNAAQLTALSSALGDRRQLLRWTTPARELEALRTRLDFIEFRKAAERLAASLSDPAERELALALAEAGSLAQKGESALRIHLQMSNPTVQAVVAGKTRRIQLTRLSLAELQFTPVDEGTAKPEKAPRAQVQLPWMQLLEKALDEQQVDQRAMVLAASLWLWGSGEVEAAFNRLGPNALLPKAVRRVELAAR